MNTKIEKINDTRKKVLVSFDGAETAKEKQAVTADFVKNATIQGFRRGKAPAAMVVKKFEKDIAASTERQLFQKAIQALNDIKEFDIFSVVDAKPQVGENGAEIEITVDVYPEVKVPAELKTSVELDNTKAANEEVDKVMEYYQNQYAKFESVDREVKKGDFVNVSYEGKIDGKLVSEIVPNATMYGTQKSTWEEAGNENAPGVKAVVNALVGMKKGDKKQAEETFAADFAIKELAGKKAVYDVEVLDVKEKVLPKFDEEFCKTLKVESEQALREKVAADIEKEKTQYNEVLKREKAVNQLMEKVEFALPESAVAEERDAILSETMMRYMQQGVTKDVLEKNKDSLIEGATKDAEIRAKMRIFLSRVAKANKIEVNNEDISRVVWQEAVRAGMKPDEFVKRLRGNQALINRIRGDALMQKTINFIAEKAEVKIKEAK